MKIYKHYQFAKWMRKMGLHDNNLKEAVAEIANGLIDADLGQGVLKKRIALPGRGKSGGARTIIAFRMDHRTIFIYGFAKNDKDNISKSDEEQLKQYAKTLLGFTEQQIKNAIKIGELIEVV